MRAFAVVATFVALTLAVPATAKDGDMPLPEFLEKASRLEARGPLALFSSDLKLLEEEVKGGAARYRARLERDAAEGRRPDSCPPRGMEISSDELLAHFRSIPAASRARMSVGDGFAHFIRSRHPCR